MTPNEIMEEAELERERLKSQKKTVIPPIQKCLYPAPKELTDRMKREAEALGMSPADFLEMIFNEYLNRSA